MDEDEQICCICGDSCTTGIETDDGPVCVPCSEREAEDGNPIDDEEIEQWCDNCGDLRPFEDGSCLRCGES